jgi:hypothetical protein
MNLNRHIVIHIVYGEATPSNVRRFENLRIKMAKLLCSFIIYSSTLNMETARFSET